MKESWKYGKTRKTEIYVNNQDGMKDHVENITINNTCETYALMGLFRRELSGVYHGCYITFCRFY